MTRDFIFTLKQKMFINKKRNINIFVNKNKTIKISPLSSFYTLKKEVQNKISPEHNLNIYYNGKKITNESVPLIKLGITDNSSLIAIPNLNGGNNSTSYLLWIIYILLVLCYFLFLASGFLTLFANIFAVTFSDTIMVVINWLLGNKKSIITGIIKLFIRFLTWILKNFITFIAVWVLTSYIMFPILYDRENKYCESALAAKSIGWWAMFIFTLFYMYLNIGDAIINVAQAVVTELPMIFDATISPGLQGFKEISDYVKYGFMYMLPGVEIYHEVVSEIIYLLFESTAVIGTFDCNNKEQAKQLCGLFNTLKDMTGGITMKTFRKNLQLLKRKGVNNLSTVKNHFKNKNSTQLNKIADQETKNQDEDPKLGLMGKLSLASSKEFIKNYRLGPGLKLLARGFCDIYTKENGKPLEENKDFPVNSFNRWSSGLFTSFFCQIVEAVNDFQTVLNNVGSDNQIVNMIETGNVAGVMSLIWIIVMMIYTRFVSSFGGYEYG
jgi:hypothetical protein